jgi:hypothetical protein
MTRVDDLDARWPTATAYARLDGDTLEAWTSSIEHRQREGYTA